MDIEINTNLSPGAFTWQDIKDVKPVDGCYYCLMEFEGQKTAPRETSIALACDGQYHVMDSCDDFVIDPSDVGESSLIMVHPVPAIVHKHHG